MEINHAVCGFGFRENVANKFAAVPLPSAFEASHADLHDFNWAFSVPKYTWKSTALEKESSPPKLCLSFTKAARTQMSTSGCNGQQFRRLLIFLQNFDQILTFRGKWVVEVVPFLSYGAQFGGRQKKGFASKWKLFRFSENIFSVLSGKLFRFFSENFHCDNCDCEK